MYDRKKGEKKAACLLPLRAQGRFTRSSTFKYPSTPSAHLYCCSSKHGLRTERQSKTSRAGLGSGQATPALTYHGHKKPFSVIIGSRYVQCVKLHGNPLTLSVDNKGVLSSWSKRHRMH